MKSIKLLLKWLVLITALLSFGLWATGYGYILKGVSMTYLVGRSGPGIDEKDSFFNDTLFASETPYSWKHPSTKNTSTLSASQLEQLESIQTASFLVIQNERLIFEQYWSHFNKNHPTNSFSAVKSLVSLLIGIAKEDGLIVSLDERVGKYLAEFNTAGKERITIRHLLTMSSGLDWHESGANPFSDAAGAYYGSNLDQLISSLTAVDAPGKEFSYQSGNTQILGLLIEKITGMSLAKYAEKNIWKKIGAEHDAYWNLDKKEGRAKAFCCFYATPRDFAKLGQLILNKGVWNQQQIVPEKYVDSCFIPANLNCNDEPLIKYGLHWWILNYKGFDVHYARGISGQYIITIPSEKIVILRTGWERGTVDSAGHPSDIYNYINIALGLTREMNA